MPVPLYHQELSRTTRDCGRSPLAQAALLSALDSGPQAVALFDPDDRLAYGNEAFCSGWSVESHANLSFSSIMRNCHERGVGAVVDTDDFETWIATAMDRRRTGPDFRAFEVDFFDGRWFWITERRLPDGWILLIGQDITALKHNEQTLRAARDVAVKASITDSLTQLNNRRGAIQQVDALLLSQTDFYLAMIDIDEFKRFNDDFGHATGDAVLISVARELRRMESLGCRVGRLSGDEFSIVSPPRSSKDDFAQLLKDFADAAGSSPYSGSHGFDVTLSVGVSRSFADGATVEELLASADAAMYEVKRNGRSAIRFFESWMRVSPIQAA
ncbi:GGDEF domain-containing protein [Aureimonas sp. SA4125]|uniref:sensor domain-containing diguanylate cyclase n=1 Tax=Aureimonas sp. SA4125 TaxID=2826993 RepID=UPI001CC7D8F0|nr:sensor domain-containing diguanylate cyclase [Aureimonas sp. SA4125]BDA83620.1 GGDEF domain-containing protein [Aureimonas sp. SA4125]